MLKGLDSNGCFEMRLPEQIASTNAGVTWHLMPWSFIPKRKMLWACSFLVLGAPMDLVGHRCEALLRLFAVCRAGSEDHVRHGVVDLVQT